MVTQMKREHALELLGISDPISHADLRKRYRLKALKYHPDKTADGNSEMFRHIHDAYELLRLEIEQEEEIDEPPGGSGYEGYMARCMNAFGVTITKDQIDDIMAGAKPRAPKDWDEPKTPKNKTSKKTSIKGPAEEL